MASQEPKRSPGDDFYPELPSMKAPNLEFVYRMQAKLIVDSGYEIPNIQGTGVGRSVVHIAGGTVRGPKISGVVIENSGADWAEAINSKQLFYRLDARYAVRTDDGHHIYIISQGLFRPGPGVNLPSDGKEEPRYLQDQVDYFTHLKFSAPGNSPYNWMNGIVALGVLVAAENSAIIDCWRLTNFPGTDVEDICVGR